MRFVSYRGKIDENSLSVHVASSMDEIATATELPVGFQCTRSVVSGAQSRSAQLSLVMAVKRHNPYKMAF